MSDYGSPRDEPLALESSDALRPAVAGGGDRSSLLLIIGAVVLLGLLVFFWLGSRRNAAEPSLTDVTLPAAGSAGGVVSAPPPPADIALAEAAARLPVAPDPLTAAVAVQPVPVAPPPPPQVIVQSPPPPAAAPVPAISVNERRRSPALVVDLGAPPQGGVAQGPPAPASGGGPAAAGAAAPAAGATTAGAAGPGVAGAVLGGAALAAGVAGGGAAANDDDEDRTNRLPPSTNVDEQFAARVSSGGTGGGSERVRATMLRNQGFVIPQGAMIPGVLETALNSDLPGYARAIVSRDVRSFDGARVLIPRGSRVIGQYRSAAALGQSRAFIIWTRVLRPDGASIQIGSSGTDPLGRAGLDGKVDRHFFQRFGGAILLSVLNAGVGALADRPSTQVVIGSGSEATSLASSAVQGSQISPTIKVPQGAPIRIFVARDLDFSPVGGVASR